VVADSVVVAAVELAQQPHVGSIAEVAVPVSFQQFQVAVVLLEDVMYVTAHPPFICGAMMIFSAAGSNSVSKVPFSPFLSTE